MKTPVRRRLAALAVALLVPTVGGCGFAGLAGHEYQTDQVYQPGVGVNNHTGTVNVLGAVVVSSANGSGTFVASLVNQDPDEPASVTSVSGDGVEVQLSSPVKVEAGSLLNLADSGAVGVSGEGVVPGLFVRLELVFESGQKSSLNVPVVADRGPFDDILPFTPAPATPSASPSS